MITIKDTKEAISFIRRHKDMSKFKDLKSKVLMDKYSISHMQANFLIAVVCAERIKASNILGS